jgi:integrase
MKLGMSQMQTKSKAPIAGRVQVAPNLYRQTAQTGTVSWVLRFQLRGRKRWMGLGPVTTLSLREVTARAGAAQKLILDGIDPIDQRRQALAIEVRKAALTVSFEAAAGQYYDQHECKWSAKSKDAFLGTMRDHVYPTIGQLPVDQVDTAMILRVLEPFWTTTHVTAGRVRGRIEAVLDWAKVRGFREGENPARWENHLAQLLPTGGELGEVEHHRALPFADVPAFVAALRQRRGIAPLALEFLVLTAARTGEVVKATWDEVDFDAKVWVRPASHMKGKVEHSVPLTPRMIEILKGLPQGGADSLIFTGKTGAALGKNALPKLMAGTGGTVHGARSSFRDWCGERTSFPRELAEFSLAHTVGNVVERSYTRSKLVEKRRPLMMAWEKYVAMPMVVSADVTPIGAAKKKGIMDNYVAPDVDDVEISAVRARLTILT